MNDPYDYLNTLAAVGSKSKHVNLAALHKLIESGQGRISARKLAIAVDYLEECEELDAIHLKALADNMVKQQAHIDELYAQLEQAQADRKHYGVHLATALKGEKLASEPEDQRLDKVRELVARNSEAEDLLNQVSLMFLMSGARSDADSHNPVERWMHDCNKWKDGSK